MSNNNLTIGLVIAMVIAIVGCFLPQFQSGLGSSGTRFPNGVSADSTSPSAGEVRGAVLTLTGDATIAGGTVTLTTSNTSTSSIIAGCIQSYATSTLTPMRLTPYASTSIGVSTTTGAAIVGGYMAWQYGSCPLL